MAAQVRRSGAIDSGNRMFRSSPPAFFELVDRHIAPAMRHVGLADR